MHSDNYKLGPLLRKNIYLFDFDQWENWIMYRHFKRFRIYVSICITLLFDPKGSSITLYLQYNVIQSAKILLLPSKCEIIFVTP